MIFLQRLWRRKLGLVSLIVILGIAVMAIFAPQIAPNDPLDQSLFARNSPPGDKYLLGGDPLGRDLLSRIIFGSRLTLSIGFGAVFFSTTVGTILGLITVIYGKLIENVIMRLVDLMLGFPWFLLCILLVAALGPGLFNVILALGVWLTPHMIRFVRSKAISVKEEEFVDAAYLIGESRPSILLHYIFPNCISQIIVKSSLDLPKAIMSGAALSFLGLGVPPPAPEWGLLLSGSREYLMTAPHVVLFPTIFLFLLTLSLNLFGDTLRDIFDTRIEDVVK